MIKELFITGLLSFTVGSTPLKQSTPKSLADNNSLFGAYCLRNEFNVDFIDERIYNNELHFVYLQEQYSTKAFAPTCYLKDSDERIDSYAYIRNLSIVYTSDDEDTSKSKNILKASSSSLV